MLRPGAAFTEYFLPRRVKLLAFLECLVMRVGFSHEVVVPVPPGMKISTPTATSISVFGTSKQKVGVLASRIRLVKKPDPYKGKGIRYEGEVVKLKQGKKK